MRMVYFFVIMVLVGSLLTGCESKTDKKLNELYAQGNGYLELGDHESAITVFKQMLEIKDNELVERKLDEAIIDKIETDISYLNLESKGLLEKEELENVIRTVNEMLEIKDSPQLRERLERARTEINAVKIVRELIGEFKNIKANIGNTFSSDAIMELIEPTKILINQLDEMELSDGSHISLYIKLLNDNPMYQLYKKEYMNGGTIISNGYEDSIIFSSKKVRVRAVVGDILKIKVPSKHN